MKNSSLKAVCYGEVLWDVFPDHEKIGGAPLNLALRLAKLGFITTMISKVGNDLRGRNIVEYLKKNDIITNLISTDEHLSTGKVAVELDKSGSATYTIEYPAAWDKIELNNELLKAVKKSDIFVYGSLASRDNVSRNTLLELLKVALYKVFDLNLRSPHYSSALLMELIQYADFIKFNDEELFEFADILDSPFNGLEQNLRFIAEKSPAKTICVTKGSHGAVLLHQGKLYYNSGYNIKVKDTVGAGDSFLASLISKLLNNKQPQDSLDFACAMGALVASHEGANPLISSEEIQKFMFPIN